MSTKLLIPLIFLFLSCSQKQEQKYLSKATMAEIIAEMELSQAVYKFHQINHQIDIISITDEIYKRNNTSKEEFDKSLKFYTQSPKDIDEIYNEVIAILVRKQVELK
ncbi:MAG: DUF4296 domain-containing protein [Flavobacteriales bacterium]